MEKKNVEMNEQAVVDVESEEDKAARKEKFNAIAKKVLIGTGVAVAAGGLFVAGHVIGSKNALKAAETVAEVALETVL